MYMLYRISWFLIDGGKSGCGNFLEKEDVRESVNILNREHRGKIFHFAEGEDGSVLNLC